MQKFLLGAILGGLTGLVLGAAFALSCMLLLDGLSDRAARVVGLCGGAAGFVGMYIGAVSGAACAIGGGRARAYVAVAAAAFGAAMLTIRTSLGSTPGGWPLVYAGGGTLIAANVFALARRWLRPATPVVDAPQRWRRFAQFRLSTLLALFVLVGALLSSLVSRTALEVRAIAQLRRLGAGVTCAIETPSWQSFLLGDASGEQDVAERVYLRGAKFGDAELTWVRYLADVRSIDISSTSATDAGLIHVRPLRRLQALSLDAPAITDAGLEHLIGLENLAYLSLRGAAVTDAGLEHLKKLRKLQTLDLSWTRITDAGISTLAAFGELEGLSLAGTNITDAGVAELLAMKKLKWLDLSQTKITDAGVSTLEELPALINVLAWQTQLTPAGQSRLREIHLKAEERALQP